jgi:hypothetical protein
MSQNPEVKSFNDHLPHQLSGSIEQSDMLLNTLLGTINSSSALIEDLRPTDGLSQELLTYSDLPEEELKAYRKLTEVSKAAFSLLDQPAKHPAEKDEDRGFTAYYRAAELRDLKVVDQGRRKVISKADREYIRQVEAFERVASRLANYTPLLPVSSKEGVEHYSEVANKVLASMAVEGVNDQLANYALQEYYKQIPQNEAETLALFSMMNVAATVTKHAEHMDKKLMVEDMHSHPELHAGFFIRLITDNIQDGSIYTDIPYNVRSFFYPYDQEVPEEISDEITQRADEIIQAVSLHRSVVSFAKSDEGMQQLLTKINQHRTAGLLSYLPDGVQVVKSIFERIDAEAREALLAGESEELVIALLGLEKWRAAQVNRFITQHEDSEEGLPKNRKTSNKTRKLLRSWHGTPFAEGLLAHAVNEQQEQFKQAKNDYEAYIEIFNAKFHAGSKSIRATEGGVAYRAQLLDHFGLSGGREQIMDKQLAQDIAYMVLNFGEDEIRQLADSLNEVEARHKQAETLTRKAFKRPKLLQVIDYLNEQIDAGVESSRLPARLHAFIEKLDSYKNMPKRKTTPTEPLTNENKPRLDDVDDCIKDILFETHSINIEAFPPDTAENDIVIDVTREVSRSRNEYVDWRRIEELVQLYRKYSELPGIDAKLLKSKNVKWSPVPYYLVELQHKDRPSPIVIAESPVYGNATYTVDDPDWPFIVQQSKQQAREYGAKAMVHSLGGEPSHHTKRLRARIEKLLQKVVA